MHYVESKISGSEHSDTCNTFLTHCHCVLTCICGNLNLPSMCSLFFCVQCHYLHSYSPLFFFLPHTHSHAHKYSCKYRIKCFSFLYTHLHCLVCVLSLCFTRLSTDMFSTGTISMLSLFCVFFTLSFSENGHAHKHTQSQTHPPVYRWRRTRR